MALAILCSIPPQDLSSWLWMSQEGFERTEFSYFRLVWDVYKGFKWATLTFSQMFLKRDKYKSRANIFWSSERFLAHFVSVSLKFMYSAHPFMNTSFHVLGLFFYSWKAWRWVLLVCSWKISRSVSHGGQAAQIPMDFNPLASSQSSFLFALAKNAALSPRGSRGHVHAPCSLRALHSFPWAWRTPTCCTFPMVGHWFQSQLYDDHFPCLFKDFHHFGNTYSSGSVIQKLLTRDGYWQHSLSACWLLTVISLIISSHVNMEGIKFSRGL